MTDGRANNIFDADAAGRSARLLKRRGKRRGFGPCGGVRVVACHFPPLNLLSDPTSDGNDEDERADSADAVGALASLAAAEACTTEARRQIRLDAAAAFAAHADVDGYAALALLG